ARTVLVSEPFRAGADRHPFPTRRSSDLASIPLHAQDSLGLQECYRLLEQNYPLMRQKDLLTRRTELTQESIRKTFLPQASLNARSEEHTSELQSRENLVCRLLLEKKKKN